MRVYYPRSDWAEQDPDELWQAFAATTREVLQKSAIDAREVLGVGVSAQMFNLLPVDENCRPVTRMLSWLDVRSVHQADRLLTEDTRAFIYQHTGNMPTAKDVVPKILWLKEERPGLWERTRWLLDCKEYILFKLTGEIAIDWHGASVFFLFNPHTKTWDEQVCARLGIPVEKPEGHRNPRRTHAASSYSCISPPSTSLRRTDAVEMATTDSLSLVSGTRSPSPRWGRLAL